MNVDNLESLLYNILKVKFSRNSVFQTKFYANLFSPKNIEQLLGGYGFWERTRTVCRQCLDENEVKCEGTAYCCFPAANHVEVLPGRCRLELDEDVFECSSSQFQSFPFGRNLADLCLW